MPLLEDRGLGKVYSSPVQAPEHVEAEGILIQIGT